MGFFDWFRKKPAAPVSTARDIELPATPKPGPSEKLISFIKHEEGFLPKAKPDVDGVFILGHGCKHIDGKPVQEGQTIDLAGADRNVRALSQLYTYQILALTTPVLTQGQLDALIDFVYNCGLGALKQSTLLRVLNSNPQTVSERLFTMWSKIHKKSGEVVQLQALFDRRKSEYNLFWIS